MSRFTYYLLLSAASPDETVNMGAIDQKAALSFVSSFPFTRELARRKANPSLLPPTITFRDNATHRRLVIWSETPGRYAVWKPDAGARAEGIRSMLHILACLTLFFDGKDKELNGFIQRLSKEGL